MKRYTFRIRIGSTYRHAVELDCFDDVDALKQANLVSEDVACIASLEGVWVEVRDAKLRLVGRVASQRVH